jgi:transcriptional regulator with GAF, ATPase, and Fis domain
MPPAWHRFFGAASQARLAVIEELRGAGFSSVEWENGAPETSGGIVFFAEPTQQVFDFICEESRQGLNRVLAVALAPSALKPSAKWALLRYGSSDTLTWNAATAAEIAARFERWREVDALVESGEVRSALVGEGQVWKSVLRQVVEAARFTDACVLLTGESGTGKELVARLIHSLGPGPLKHDVVLVDCSTIVPELSGSEFYGHEKGAYTGAVLPRDGAFALAHGGTLFLDEVGELPPGLQAQLLRVVQEHTYKRVGGNTWQRADFRLVCATNRDLDKEAEAGRFRRDFYHRIAGICLRLPPLRERAADIPLLARYFLAQLQPNGDAPGLDPAVESWLLERAYPGNIRDLKQIITRIWSRHVGTGPITPGEVPPEDRPTEGTIADDWRDDPLEAVVRRALSAGAGMKEIGRAAQAAAERIAIEDEQGNLPRAARRLGISDRALQMRRASYRKPPAADSATA